MDLGAFETPGRFPVGERQNRTLLPVFDALSRTDVAGCSCLDIGAMSGLVSFGLSRLGASRVVATDALDVASFRLARDVLGLDVEYHPRTQFDTLRATLEGERFDLIVCAGVLYHMLNPFSAIAECRKMLNPGGLLILETAFAPQMTEPGMLFNASADRPDPEPYTYWRPSASGVEGMMQLAAFDVLDDSRLLDPPRLAVIGRAVAPEAVSERSPLMTRMHELDLCDETLKLDGLESGPTVSGPAYRAGERGRVLDPASHAVKFPFHIDYPESAVGRGQRI
ncbi:MAG: SAM-dependent methyltransferase [Phycisphaerales bacterium]|jgi:SAM-dependent methyltransferase